jgi:uncharacterized cupin superfamily protein
VVPEARLRSTEHGRVAEGDGWFVVGAHEARWREDAFAPYCTFEGDERFTALGINISVLRPGRSNGMYHREGSQEDFLILAGECLLLIEGEERRLKAWDFVHCPPGTDHIFVGAGDGPCLLLAAGRRPSSVTYPVSELARRHEAGVDEETSSPDEAYARFPRAVDRRYEGGWLPDL